MVTGGACEFGFTIPDVRPNADTRFGVTKFLSKQRCEK